MKRRRAYHGDALTLRVVMDRAYSATLNGRRIENPPGSDLREAVIIRAAMYARRVGRPLPVDVEESRAECTLLVHPNGAVEALGLVGRQRAQRWLPLTTSSADLPNTMPSSAPPASLDQTRPTRSGRLKGRARDPLARTADTATSGQGGLKSLPRYGERPGVLLDSQAQGPDMDSVTTPANYDDETVRLAAQHLGLTPDALAAALWDAEQNR
jgi:hypothetical protein